MLHGRGKESVNFMWSYERRLQYPVNIKQTNPKLAMKNRQVAGVLTDIGTEELAHMEMVSAIVHQLTCNLTPDQIEGSPFANYYVDHTLGIWPQAASGAPWTAAYFQSKGDPITDIHEDMAAEQKARTTYENILRLVHDHDICDPIRYLREREIVHYQRFGEANREDCSKSEHAQHNH